jgi:hypothetical protein
MLEALAEGQKAAAELTARKGGSVLGGFDVGIVPTFLGHIISGIAENIEIIGQLLTFGASALQVIKTVGDLSGRNRSTTANPQTKDVMDLYLEVARNLKARLARAGLEPADAERRSFAALSALLAEEQSARALADVVQRKDVSA